MQVVISAICTQGRSLRTAIGDDRALEAHGLVLVAKQTPGREPGWLKIRSADSKRGAINIAWDSQTNVLTARVVTRSMTKPSLIIGDFTNYLLSRHHQRIRVITSAVVR